MHYLVVLFFTSSSPPSPHSSLLPVLWMDGLTHIVHILHLQLAIFAPSYVCWLTFRLELAFFTLNMTLYFLLSTESLSSPFPSQYPRIRYLTIFLSHFQTILFLHASTLSIPFVCVCPQHFLSLTILPFLPIPYHPFPFLHIPFPSPRVCVLCVCGL